ncbi:MAG: 4Fe-4S dicluster domain-containing protein [Nanoarchaeota archaeon]
MQVYQLEKKGLQMFLLQLAECAELIAPVKEDVVRFQAVKDPSTICFEGQAYLPAKSFFFRQEEVLFHFTGNKITVPAYKTPNRVFFGLRRCDLNAIMHQDKAFINSGDLAYESLRKNSLIIGYHCNTAPSPYCFCGSLDLEEFFDLMVYDHEDHYLVEIGSERGKELIAKHKALFKETKEMITAKDKVIPGADRLKKKDMSKLYDHPDWKKGIDICLSCAACTTLCPTCYCFEIHDEITVANPKAGERKRAWSSCQLPEFTKVAGGHVFRKERADRFKHRIFHQLHYNKERYGINLCVGCGRCISGCPTRIDFVHIINEMK